MPASFTRSDAGLITARLLLRQWSTVDIFTAADGRRRTGWAEDFPAEGDETIAGLIRDNPAWLGDYGHRLLVERDTGEVVGSAGLFAPPADGTLELGYGVVPSRRGRGYATEAAAALAEFGLTADGVHTVFATVEPGNPASVRVLQRAGFRFWDSDGTYDRYRMLS